VFVASEGDGQVIYSASDLADQYRRLSAPA